MKKDTMQPRRFSTLRFILGVVSLIASIGLIRSIVDHWQKQGIIAERREALMQEEERNRELITKLEEATSAAFIEKEAREKLGLVKEGDTIVLMPNDKLQMTNESNTQENLPNWKKWWRLFF